MGAFFSEGQPYPIAGGNLKKNAQGIEVDERYLTNWSEYRDQAMRENPDAMPPIDSKSASQPVSPARRLSNFPLPNYG